ncbi:aromatic acid exporter family protein [Rossellomorea aquimaris]|uniref:aromatic acid exporter family protein n=1 Tax=Rossellomorea aquimaris TaxID=189382 RepID=UPI001CD3DDBA|nr:aromatic acid exporter family protein [Rossellomorea aquimaris]MCA1056093.1 aromatic acid exporter family protein [Rossellomorea aquimaris]
MNFLKKFRFAGGRIAKTGIAVFLTAFVCELMNWPAMFAVITAIVTIEPTAADSIKKAFIRFPASAIGALFAVIISPLLGHHAVTYALVAILTIITCHKLRLDAGILVATLTGIAMIPTIHDHYIATFFIRLGSTSLGLIVSTLVNLWILPPKYSPIISRNIHDLYVKTGNLLERRGIEVLQGHSLHRETKLIFTDINREIDKTNMLCDYQKEEMKLHRSSRQQLRDHHYQFKKLNLLRQIHFHIGNLVYLPVRHSFTEQQKEKILSAIQSIKAIMNHPSYDMQEGHFILMKELLQEFWEDHHDLYSKEFKSIRQHFSCETILLYELLSIHDLLEELNQIHTMEKQHEHVLEKTLQI